MSKLLNGAKIISEFSQAKVLDAISAELPMPTEHEKIVNGGICYALSLEWICGSISKAEDKLGSLMPFEADKPFAPATCAYYKQIANGFIAYSDTIGRQCGTPAKDLFTGVEKLPVTITRRERDNYFAGLWSKKIIKFDRDDDTSKADSFDMILSNLTDRMFFLRFGLKEGGHRVAFINMGGKIYFFDPNFGVYSANDLKLLFSSLDNTYHIMSSYASSCPRI